MKINMTKKDEEFHLNHSGIDQISELVFDTLLEQNVDSKDALRHRLAIEDMLLIWQKELGNVPCHFRCDTHFGRKYITVAVTGNQCEPKDSSEHGEPAIIYSTIVAQSGAAPTYSYSHGENRLSIEISDKKKISPIAWLLITIALAVGLGLLCRSLPASIRGNIGVWVDPIFNVMMGVLSGLAGPLIFFGVSCGIVGIGDVSTLGKIGKIILTRLFGSLLIFGTIVSLIGALFFHSESSTTGSGSGAVFQLYQMLLDIIPKNMIEPFVSGNTLQIIFLGICIGLAMLVIEDKCSVLRNALEQANLLIQFIMNFLSKYILVFTFISVFDLIISDSFNQIYGLLFGFLFIIACAVPFPFILILIISIRCKVPLRILLNKMLPTYLIAFSTASSSASLSICLETCKKRLGISDRVVNFGIPFGIIIYKPGMVLALISICYVMASTYHITITIPWVITLITCSILVSAAAPPVPGGAMSCYIVLFTQLGIPSEAVAVAIAWDILTDYFGTSCGISSLQSILVLAANKLNMLNKDLLRRE